MDQYGGEKKSKKTKKTIKNSTKPNTKKPAAKKTTKTTKTRSKAKGGNFLGAVGDLVAPTGWGPFATAAGLLAVDRVSAALRRGTKEKKEKMKGGKKMKGGLIKEDCRVESHVNISKVVPMEFNLFSLIDRLPLNNSIRKKFMNEYYNKKVSFNDSMTIFYIKNTDNTYSLKITGNMKNSNSKSEEEFSHCFTKLRFNTIEDAIKYAKDPEKQMLLGVILVREYARNKKINIPNNYLVNLTSLPTSS